MHSRTVVALLLLLLALGSCLLAAEPAPAPAAPEAAWNPMDLVKQWDSLRYYNRELGLKDFGAEFTCQPYSDALAAQLGSQATFKLYWRWPGEVRVVAAGSSDQMRSAATPIASALEGHLAQLIPKPFAEVVGRYQIKIGVDEKTGGKVLIGEALDNQNPVRRFTTYLDKAGNEVSTNWLTMEGVSITRRITGSTPRDGRLLITDIVMDIKRADNTSTTKEMHWDYAAVGKLWLPARMTVNYKDQAPVIFVFTRPRANGGVPASLFKERGK